MGMGVIEMKIRLLHTEINNNTAMEIIRMDQVFKISNYKTVLNCIVHRVIIHTKRHIFVPNCNNKFDSMINVSQPKKVVTVKLKLLSLCSPIVLALKFAE